jgi:hypothetical protein
MFPHFYQPPRQQRTVKKQFANISMRQRHTLGPPRPQTLRQGMIPCTPPGDQLECRSKQLPPVAGNCVPLSASGLLKAGKIPGESELSTWDYSSAFPGCKGIRVGRFQRPGQKHKAAK